MSKLPESTSELWEVFDPATGELIGMAWSLKDVAKSFNTYRRLLSIQLDAKRLLLSRRS